MPRKTVRVDGAATHPDLTISLAGSAAADFKLYVRSARFSREEAARAVRRDVADLPSAQRRACGSSCGRDVKAASTVSARRGRDTLPA
jgi:hypothetical protein